jgi:hypothetical protein
MKFHGQRNVFETTSRGTRMADAAMFCRHAVSLLRLLLAAATLMGCDASDNPPAAAADGAPAKATSEKTSRDRSMEKRPAKSPAVSRLASPKQRAPADNSPFTIVDDSTGDAASNTGRPKAAAEKPADSTADSAADSTADPAPDATIPSLDATAAPFDVDAAVGAGFRKLAGKHLTLLTDVASSPAVDELPKVVDAALEPWLKYLGVDPAQLDGWMLYAVLMNDRKKATAAGLLPADLPQFLHGYARANMVWLDDQTTDYYRRHLLLHEATHATMYRTLGSAGPPWFSEGMAELLATHHWADGKLAVRYFPKSRDETPGLGRIRLIRDEFSANRRLSFADVLAFDNRAHLRTEAYAWSWAACVFLDSHPAYRKKFPQLLKHVTEGAERFNVALRQIYADELDQLFEAWQVFVADLEHDYDFERTAIDFRAGKPIAAPMSIKVRADRGWQNSGIALQAGKAYRLAATGRYQLATQPRIWWSEPGGVSIRYYQGRPLGQLLAAVHSDQRAQEKASVFLSPTVVGAGAALTPAEAGTLYFKINDSAGELADNAGELSVEITPQ